MNRVFVIAIVLATSCHRSPPTAVDAPPNAQVGEHAATDRPAPNHYATRARPRGTFDLLTPPIAADEVYESVTNIPPGWVILGRPVQAEDPVTKKPSSIVVESATLSGRVYRVIVHNTGKESARFIADVPCAGCP